MSQNFNLDAILYFPLVRYILKEFSIPHFSVKDISKIDPKKLKELGFQGLIFDKDNTLTAPYKNEIFSTIANSFEEYKSIFGKKIAIMSNSAGTKDDKNYVDARKIEHDLGIKVLRHDRKKPGGINSVIDYFNCNPKNLVMFGDRIFTDIVFGNRYGMLTIHTALLTGKNDNKAASKIRNYEIPYIKKLIHSGHFPPFHLKYNSDICLESLI